MMLVLCCTGEGPAGGGAQEGDVSGDCAGAGGADEGDRGEEEGRDG